MKPFHWTRLLTGAVGLSLALGAQAAEVKIGLLSQFSGQYAYWGQEYRRGVEMAMAEVGGKVGGHTLNIIERDEGGLNPQRVRQISQELVVRDQVQYLAGGAFTPTVMAAATVINQAKVPYVVFNAGTASVTKASPYYVRVGVTQWALNIPATKWAYDQGARKAAVIVADYAPGQDAQEAFVNGFKHAGGEMIEQLRVPVGTVDFTSYIQRLKDSKPQYVFTFMPLGPMSVGLVKAFENAQLDKQGITPVYTVEMQDADLPAVGNAALDAVSALHYGPYVDNPRNKAWVKTYRERYGADQVPSMATIAAYDGMQVIFAMIKATNGQPDPDKAVAATKGLKWDSPRGPVSIDANREIVQNIYIRKVERMPDGRLGNRTVQTFPSVEEPWHKLNP